MKFAVSVGKLQFPGPSTFFDPVSAGHWVTFETQQQQSYRDS